MIVDSQVHIWDAESPERPWVDGAASYAHGPSFSAEALIARMDETQVDMAVLVPPSWEGDRNDTCLDALRAHPGKFLVMGRVDVMSPMTDDQLLELSAEMAGLRLTFRREPAVQQLMSGAVDWLWASAERLGIPIAVYAPASLDVLDDIATRHPDLKMMVDHLGLPLDVRGDRARHQVGRLCALSRHRALAVKASCLPNNFREPYPFPTIRDVVEEVVGAFGPERVFWGSDLSRLPCPYEELVSFFEHELTGLDKDAVEGVLGAGVLRWLGQKELS
jgi:L-fuconolactonase